MIVGDAQAEERFLLSACGFTQAEQIVEFEANVWRHIVERHEQEYVHIMNHTSLLTADLLLAEETCARQVMEQDQVRCFNELCLVTELLRYGCDESASMYADGHCALPLIHMPSPTREDESWKDLPTMVELDTSEHRPERYTLAAATLQLEAMSSADNDLLQILESAIFASETDKRRLVLEAEAEQRKRLQTQHRQLADGILSIEKTIETEFMALQIARLPVDERLGFITRPARAQEHHAREIISLMENAEFDAITLQAASSQTLLGFYHESNEIGKELERRRTLHRHVTMSQRRMRTHGAMRFSDWYRWLSRRKNLQLQQTRLGDRVAASKAILLYRYCCRWRDTLIRPRLLQQQRDMCWEAFIGCYSLVGREDEERHRNALLNEELVSRQYIEESFLGARDQIKEQQLRTSIQDLEVQSVNAHRLLALSRWYSLVRDKQLRAKSEWLRSQSESSTMHNYFTKWLRAPPEVRSARTVRHQLFRFCMVSAEKESLISIEEVATREEVQIEEMMLFHRIAVQIQESLLGEYQRVLELRTGQLAVRSNVVHMATAWQRWWAYLTKFQGTTMRLMQLKRRNEATLAWRYFSTWNSGIMPKYVAKRELISSAMVELHCMAMEGTEAQGRLMIAHREEIVSLRTVRLSMRRLQRIASPESEDHVSHRVEISMRCSVSAIMRNYVQKWGRYVAKKQRKEAAITEYIPNLERHHHQRVLVGYFWKWMQYCVDRRQWDAVMRELVRLPTLYEDTRIAMCNEEVMAFQRIQSQYSASLLQAFQQRRFRLAQELAVQNSKRLMLRYWAEWLRRGQRAQHRSASARLVAATGPRATRRMFFVLWETWRQQRKYLDALRVLRSTADKQLMRRYFVRFAPHNVRLARVSRAKSNLERAQSAAKLLALPDVSVPSRVAGPLPPIRRAAADSEPARSRDPVSADTVVE